MTNPDRWLVRVFAFIALLTIVGSVTADITSYPQGYFSSLVIGQTSGNAGSIKLYGGAGHASAYTQISSDANGTYLTFSNPWVGTSISPTAFAARADDYAPTGGTAATTWYLTTTGAQNISGIANGFAERELQLCNVNVSGSIGLLHASTSSVAANRFTFVTAASHAITPGACATLKYDANVSLWRLKATTTTLVVGNGGIGAVTETNHGVLLGQGTAAIVATAVGSTTQVLKGVTGADPVWGWSYLLSGNGGGLTCASNTTCFGPVSGQAKTAFSTSSAIAQASIIPVACTLSNFYVQTVGTNGAQNTVFSLDVNNGTPSGLTATSVGLDAAQVYSDTTHTYTLTAGDRVALKMVQGNGAASALIGGVSVLCQ